MTALSNQTTFRRYPVRNNLWMDHGNGTFSSEVSMMAHAATQLDPWNRQMPAMNAERDAELEIVQYSGTTTVTGIEVKLVVFNT